MTEETANYSSGDALLTQELGHYRDRWQSTQHLVGQRMTLLLTAVGSSIVLSTAVLANGPHPGSIDAGPLLAGLWIVVAAASEGIFLRLIRARRSICKDIGIINKIRSALILRAEPDIADVLRVVLEVDSSTPRVFSVLSIPSSAALVVASSVFVAPWLADSRLTHRPPLPSYLLGIGVMAFDFGIFFVMDRRFDKYALSWGLKG